MDVKRLSHGSARIWCLVFETDEEPISGLLQFAGEEGIQTASLTGIGAFCDVTLAYFDWKRKEYEPIPVHEQVEVASMVGNLALSEDGNGLKVHAHTVVARRNGTTLGGHLLKARVRPTLEVVLTEAPEPLRRVYDPATGLALLDASVDDEKRGIWSEEQ